MSIEWFIYLADISCEVKTLLRWVGVVVAIIGICVFLATLEHEVNEVEQTRKSCVKGMVIGVLLVAIQVFIPSERTIYMMAGAHYGMEALQSETAQKVAKLLNGKLDEELAKLGEGR